VIVLPISVLADDRVWNVLLRCDMGFLRIQRIHHFFFDFVVRVVIVVIVER
jgi:hypothetical protein